MLDLRSALLDRRKLIDTLHEVRDMSLASIVLLKHLARSVCVHSSTALERSLHLIGVHETTLRRARDLAIL